MKGGDDAAKAAVGGAALEKNTAAAGNNLLRVMGINDEAERSSREECRRNRDDDGNRSNILSLAMIGMQIGRRHYRSSSAMAMGRGLVDKNPDIHVEENRPNFGGKLHPRGSNLAGDTTIHSTWRILPSFCRRRLSIGPKNGEWGVPLTSLRRVE